MPELEGDGQKERIRMQRRKSKGLKLYIGDSAGSEVAEEHKEKNK